MLVLTWLSQKYQYHVNEESKNVESQFKIYTNKEMCINSLYH